MKRTKCTNETRASKDIIIRPVVLFMRALQGLYYARGIHSIHYAPGFYFNVDFTLVDPPAIVKSQLPEHNSVARHNCKIRPGKSGFYG